MRGESALVAELATEPAGEPGKMQGDAQPAIAAAAAAVARGGSSSGWCTWWLRPAWAALRRGPPLASAMSVATTLASCTDAAAAAAARDAAVEADAAAGAAAVAPSEGGVAPPLWGGERGCCIGSDAGDVWGAAPAANAAATADALCCLSRRRLVLFQWFLMALSVRPGSHLAISAQRLPKSW